MKAGGKGYIFVAVMCAALLLNSCACTEKETNNIYVPTPTPEPIIDETITVYTLGDNLLHMPVVKSGKKADGTYDFSHIFAGLQPEIKNADIAVIGQETVFGGEKFGYSGYPLFNSPSDMGKTLVNEGFDVVLHASNHVLDKWAEGAENTISFWKEYPEISVIGINESFEEQNTVKINNVKGAEIALLNYTYGTNGFKPPVGKEYLVNYIDNEKIKRDALFAEENADFTIAFMHWGTEYSTKPNESQKVLAKNMCEWGADLIIGAHPHVIQPMEWVESENGNRALVYYSLGNFVSRQQKAINLLGAAADVSLKYDGKSVTIDEYSFNPIVTHYSKGSKDFCVYNLKDYTDELAAAHGVLAYGSKVSNERWLGMIEEVFEGYNTNDIDHPHFAAIHENNIAE